MKRIVACHECRRTRRKCIEADSGPHAPCVPCTQRNLKCSKSSRPVDSQRLAPAISPTQSRDLEQHESVTLSFEETTECIHLYFRFIHDCPHSLFHEKTLLAQVEQDSMPQSLLSAICAMGCRFSTNAKLQNCGADLRIQSSRIFSGALETISLPNIQTCILLANLYAAENNNDLEALYFGIANRMAHVLRLHEPHVEDSFIQREIKCRIWCTLFMADRWCPPGLGLPREIMGFDHLHELLTDEIIFQSTTEPIVDSPDHCGQGLWRYMITLVDILGPIQDLNQLLVEQVGSEHVETQIDRLAERLQCWCETLPKHLMLNDRNLDFYQSHGHGRTFVALHLGYHHYSTLLFFRYLDLASESTPEARIYANRCRFHASSFSKLLQNARARDDCQVVYLTVAHMTLVSSSVLLHSLLFGEEIEVEAAREQLISNFEALIELRKYWPNIDSITQRLIIFQRACLQSVRTRTHKIDKWMIRYLLEHALPLEEKDPTSPDMPSTSTEDALSRRSVMLDKVFADLRA